MNPGWDKTGNGPSRIAATSAGCLSQPAAAAGRSPRTPKGGAGTGTPHRPSDLAGAYGSLPPSTGTSVFAFGVPRPVAASQPFVAANPGMVGSPPASPWNVLSPVVMSWNSAL